MLAASDGNMSATEALSGDTGNKDHNGNTATQGVFENNAALLPKHIQVIEYLQSFKNEQFDTEQVSRYFQQI